MNINGGDLQKLFDERPIVKTELPASVPGPELIEQQLAQHQQDLIDSVMEAHYDLFDVYEGLRQRVEQKAEELSIARAKLSAFAPKLVDATPAEHKKLLVARGEQANLVAALGDELNELTHRSSVAFIRIFTAEEAQAQSEFDQLAQKYREKTEALNAEREKHLRYVNSPDCRRTPDAEYERQWGQLKADLLVINQEFQKVKARLAKAKRALIAAKKELSI